MRATQKTASGKTEIPPAGFSGNGAEPIISQEQPGGAGQPIEAKSEPVNFDEFNYSLPPEMPSKLVELKVDLVKRPDPREFFRVDARPEMQRSMALHGADDGYKTQFYAVSRLVQEQLGRRRCGLYRVRVCYGHETGLFLWALRQPNPTFANDWQESAWEIAELGETWWIAMEPNEARTRYGYRTSQAMPPWNDPTPTTKTMDELIGLSLKDRYIRDLNHPIFQQYRGEI